MARHESVVPVLFPQSLYLRNATHALRFHPAFTPYNGCPDSQEVFRPLFKPHCYAPLETPLTTLHTPGPRPLRPLRRPPRTYDFHIREIASSARGTRLARARPPPSSLIATRQSSRVASRTCVDEFLDAYVNIIALHLSE